MSSKIDLSILPPYKTDIKVVIIIPSKPWFLSLSSQFATSIDLTLYLDGGHMLDLSLTSPSADGCPFTALHRYGR